MVLNPHELSLNMKPSYVPKTINEYLKEVRMIRNVAERSLKMDDLVKRLEEEMTKIQAFQRELPLTLLLINDAIVSLKEEVIQCKKTNMGPVLEEFLPLKKSCDEAEKDDVNTEESRDKKNWMSCVQLWNSTENNNLKPNLLVEAIKENGPMADTLYSSCKSRIHGRTFVPFVAAMEEIKEEVPVPMLSLLTPGASGTGEELGPSVLSPKTSSSNSSSSSGGSSSGPFVQSNARTSSQPPQKQTSRKQRRCWSQELHRRFINALQQLGGSQAATPKQIRELMQVDGLTNDEIKSHLQKYRLHTRKNTAALTASGNPTNPSAFALGGLWNDQCCESSRQSSSQNGSPQGALQLTKTGMTSTTGGDSMEEEEAEKSESYNWKTRIHNVGKANV